MASNLKHIREQYYKWWNGEVGSDRYAWNPEDHSDVNLYDWGEFSKESKIFSMDLIR